MVARYGDYVLLKPPFKTGTLVLWLGAPLRAAGRRRRILLHGRCAARAPTAPLPPPLSDEERDACARWLDALLASADAANSCSPFSPRRRSARC